MQRDKWSWVLPATGIAFVVIAVVAAILLGGGQDPSDKTPQEIINYYDDHNTQQGIGSFLIGLAGIFFLFFAGALRSFLRTSAGERSVLPTVAYAGGIVFVAAVAVGASLNLTLVDLADDLDPVAVQAVDAISYDYYLPFAIGFVPFLIASGISVVRSGALPKWLGWVPIVLGIAGYTPAGFFAFIAALVWVLIVSIMLTQRARSATKTPTATPPAPA
jgi:hypothetical protein